jgi:multidrug efflux pump
MSLGTLLTIFVVPTIYTLLARTGIPGEITTPADETVRAPA